MSFCVIFLGLPGNNKHCNSVVLKWLNSFLNAIRTVDGLPSIGISLNFFGTINLK